MNSPAPPNPKIKLGILGSTRGTDLQAIVTAIAQGSINAEVKLVISNRRDATILERANAHGIPTRFISHQNKTREDFDLELSAALKDGGVELVLLIGFMRILSAAFLSDWPGRVMNVHPSLLPAFAGGMDTNVHAEVLKAGARETGCTVHLVTEDVDAGPIIVQMKCPVRPDDTAETLKARVQALEGAALIESVRRFQAGDL